MKIVLHNSEQKESRELVASIKEEGVVVIDWYKQHAVDGHECKCVNGQPYQGPGPSSFPEVVFWDDNPPGKVVGEEDGMVIMENQAPAWARIREATSLDTTDRKKIDTRKEDDDELRIRSK